MMMMVKQTVEHIRQYRPASITAFVFASLAVVFGLVATVTGIIAAASRIPDSDCKEHPTPVDDKLDKTFDLVSTFFCYMALPVLGAGVFTLIGAGLHMAGAIKKHKGIFCSSSPFFAVSLILCIVAVMSSAVLSRALGLFCDNANFSWLGDNVVCGGDKCQDLGAHCCMCGLGLATNENQRCEVEQLAVYCENQHKHICEHMRGVQGTIVVVAIIKIFLVLAAAILPCVACCCRPEKFDMPGGAAAAPQQQPQQPTAAQPEGVVVGQPV